jgi:hypothetical protein
VDREDTIIRRNLIKNLEAIWSAFWTLKEVAGVAGGGVVGLESALWGMYERVEQIHYVFDAWALRVEMK